MSVSGEYPFGREQTFDSYGTSGMNSGSADTDFGTCETINSCVSDFRFVVELLTLTLVALTQAKPVAICKTRAGIVKNACAVHVSLELFGLFFVFCHDDLGVTAAVRMNVINGILETFDYFNATLKCSIFGSH